jgi:hypothetical protein
VDVAGVAADGTDLLESVGVTDHEHPVVIGDGVGKVAAVGTEGE